MATIDDFKKLDIRVGTVVSAEKVEGADKLLKLEFDFGDEKRQVVSGIAETYNAEEMVGKQIPVIFNLEPREIFGIESQGMILAATDEGKPVVLTVDKKVPAGSTVR